MSAFPDFMRMDLTKLTCSGCFLILLSLLLALGTAIGGGFLLLTLFPAWFPDGRPERWTMGVLLIAGLAVGAGFFQLGRVAMKRLGLRMYREGHAPPEELE